MSYYARPIPVYDEELITNSDGSFSLERRNVSIPSCILPSRELFEIPNYAETGLKMDTVPLDPVFNDFNISQINPSSNENVD